MLRTLGRMSQERYLQHKTGIFRKVEYLDLLTKFPYPDNSFRRVFSSHVVEHIPRRRAPLVLAEIFRVLVPGGILRTAVPNLTFFVNRYSPERADEFVREVFAIEQQSEKNRHHWMYSDYTLALLHQNAGFVDVNICGFRDGACENIDELDNRPEQTLFLEGRKPIPGHATFIKPAASTF